MTRGGLHRHDARPCISPRRALGLAILLWFGAIFLGGCWDRTEVDDLAIVDAVGIDAAPAGQVRVTLETMLPLGYATAGAGPTAGGGGSHGPSSAVASALGDTISQAVYRIQQGIPQRLFYGNVNAVIVGYAFAKSVGIQPVVDFLVRSRTARLSVVLWITRADATTILQTSPPYTPLPGQALSTLGRARLVPSPEFYRLAQVVLEPGRGAILPEVEVRRAAPSPPSPGGQSDQTPQAPAPQTLAVEGAALLRGPYPVAWMTPVQARGALWLSGRLLEAEIVLNLPEGGRLTVKVDRARIRRRAVLRAGQPAVIVSADATVNISDDAGAQVDLGNPTTIKQLNTLLADQIRQQMTSVLALSRAQGADAFGFGRLVAAELPRQWAVVGRDWPRSFSTLPVILRVTGHILRPGNLLGLQTGPEG